MGLVLNEVDTLVTKDTEKVGLPIVFFASILTSKASPQEFKTLVVRKSGQREDFSLVEKDQIRSHLDKTDTHKSIGHKGLHPEC